MADVLELDGLDPAVIEAQVATRTNKSKAPDPLQMAKEARLVEKERRLANERATKAPPSKAPPPPPEPPPPAIDKSAVLDKITAYRERFTHLKKRNNVSVKSSEAELMDELHFIETQLGSRTDTRIGSQLVFAAAVGIEYTTSNVFNPLNLDLAGLGQVVKTNMTEFDPIIDELMIKYGAGLYVSPEWRLCMLMATLVMTVHAANAGNPAVLQAMTKMNEMVQPPPGSEAL